MPKRTRELNQPPSTMHSVPVPPTGAPTTITPDPTPTDIDVFFPKNDVGAMVLGVWIDKKIEVYHAKHDIHYKGKAKCHGAFAVYTCPEVKGYHMLQHMVTGQPVVYAIKEEDVQRIGKELWERFCMAFRQDTVEEIVKRLPPWVRKWIEACSEAKAYVAYQGFERE